MIGGQNMTLRRVTTLSELREAGRKVVKVGARQIVLFHGQGCIYACNNRCPHEGFPLAEGVLSDGRVLTCNWHNWKFDLESGETLRGGDRLRRYPVEVRGDAVWLDVADAPAEQTIRRGLANLRASFQRFEFDRMARELARLAGAGAGADRVLTEVIGWSHDHLEYGFTHAYAAAAEWLALRDRLPAGAAPELRLVPVLEAVSHIAWDSLRESAFPFAEGARPYSGDDFVAAVEAEDEVLASELIRGALRDGLTYRDLEPALAGAALAHYNSFGHSAIYVTKTGALMARLGAAAAEPLLLALTRQLVNATREEMIPEFRHYAGALEAWQGASGETVASLDFRGLSVRRALALAASSGAGREALYDALMDAAAWNMLHFDGAIDEAFDNPVSRNIGWLDFTHAITFANAVRKLCRKYPDLWPRGLLQMACFAGRNAGFVAAGADAGVGQETWHVGDRDEFFDRQFAALLDHGEFRHIVACHRLKVLAAAREEISQRPDAPWAEVLLAAVNRYLNSPIKNKHLRRTARQSLAFVAAEG